MTAVQTLTKQNLQSVLSFDGQNDYLEIKEPFENNTAFTISLWINPAILNSNYHGFIGKQGDAYRKPGMWVSPSNNGLHYDSYDTSGNRYSNILNNFFESKDKWVHIAWVKENTEYKIYRDGELFATESAPVNFYTTNTSYWLGRVDNFFVGKMAEVRIWNKARSQDEIKQDMNHRLTGKEEGLMAYYPLNGDVLDNSSNNNNGTIHGTTWTEENLDFLQPLKANVEIAEIVYHGHVKRTQSDEYIEIRNSGNAAADLSNWKVTSIGKNQLFAFPEGTTLAAGQMIRVYTNEVHQESGGFSFGSKTAIWNDKGDMGKLLDAEGNEVSSFSYGNQAKSENSVDSIKAELGIAGLKVNISETDIKQLMTPQTKVSFLDAFRIAMNSYMEDGNLSESPLNILQELPGEYGLSDNPNAQEMSEKMKELLNDCGIELLTDAEDPADEWAGKVMCDETGESYGTNSYWIFKLSPSQFTDMNYAVVDKAGVKPTINWGFS